MLELGRLNERGRRYAAKIYNVGKESILIMALARLTAFRV